MTDTSPSDHSRSYPARPVLAASVAVFRDGRVLLAARGREPMRGVFTLPGGAVEAGETLVEAARRELFEETGLEIGEPAFVTHEEVILRDRGGAVERHFVICVFAVSLDHGDPAPSEEAIEFRWADPAGLGDLPTTPGLDTVLARAREKLGA
jgi:8-oxo-dGTP diphosphatase